MGILSYFGMRKVLPEPIDWRLSIDRKPSTPQVETVDDKKSRSDNTSIINVQPAIQKRLNKALQQFEKSKNKLSQKENKVHKLLAEKVSIEIESVENKLVKIRSNNFKARRYYEKAEKAINKKAEMEINDKKSIEDAISFYEENVNFPSNFSITEKESPGNKWSNFLPPINYLKTYLSFSKRSIRKKQYNVEKKKLESFFKKKVLLENIQEEFSLQINKVKQKAALVNADFEIESKKYVGLTEFYLNKSDGYRGTIKNGLSNIHNASTQRDSDLAEALEMSGAEVTEPELVKTYEKQLITEANQMAALAGKVKTFKEKNHITTSTLEPAVEIASFARNEIEEQIESVHERPLTIHTSPVFEDDAISDISAHEAMAKLKGKQLTRFAQISDGFLNSLKEKKQTKFDSKTKDSFPELDFLKYFLLETAVYRSYDEAVNKVVDRRNSVSGTLDSALENNIHSDTDAPANSAELSMPAQRDALKTNIQEKEKLFLKLIGLPPEFDIPIIDPKLSNRKNFVSVIKKLTQENEKVLRGFPKLTLPQLQKLPDKKSIEKSRKMLEAGLITETELVLAHRDLNLHAKNNPGADGYESLVFSLVQHMSHKYEKKDIEFQAKIVDLIMEKFLSTHRNTNLSETNISVTSEKAKWILDQVGEIFGEKIKAIKFTAESGKILLRPHEKDKDKTALPILFENGKFKAVIDLTSV